jgi:hypothetical protein
MRPLKESMIEGAKALESRHGKLTLQLKREEIYARLMTAPDQETVRLLVDQLVASLGMDVLTLLEQHHSTLQSIIEHTEELVGALPTHD